MHQIRFRLLGELTALPQSASSGHPVALRLREGREGKGRKEGGRGELREEWRDEREMTGKGMERRDKE